MSSQVQLNLLEALSKAIEIVYDKKVREVVIRPNYHSKPNELLREIENWLNSLGFKRNKSGVYESIVDGECVKVFINTNADGLSSVVIGRSVLEACYPEFLAELIRRELWVKEVEA